MMYKIKNTTKMSLPDISVGVEGYVPSLYLIIPADPHPLMNVIAVLTTSNDIASGRCHTPI